MADEPGSFRFSRVAIIGIGLIGSSVALALRAKGFEGPIAIGDRNGDALRVAAELELGTSYHTSAAKAVAGADLVMLCVPVGAMSATGRAIAPALAEGAIVTDTGSVKESVIEALTGVLPAHARVVAGHPIAGSEQSGPRAGYGTLFERRWSILTPTEGTDPEAVDIVADMWRRFGSEIELMDPKRHDLVLAITSHLPHLIAYNIVRTAYDMESVAESEVIKFSAGGFRDFTRIAASDPTMWRDVFLNNREAVLETLGRFSEDLASLQRAIRWGEGDLLYEVFERTRAIRMGIIDAGQDTAAPDFGRPRSHTDGAPEDGAARSVNGERG
ncbi:prephenate/arogenate dehydrogenase family protein [Acuticoccus sp. M5D2P5]|uniref:prephenate/arogenate dehydrogenase family protein n=1 Tax=Acuticoccus kalidii TaxID=2910977 RepID=UPI001F338646|nr:prephenate/arogenate dehydrogenase family protein [Acuticoccus kalidii]MCF3932785.1 prephenate/arogenate dehydrogenase family protein [Acuticoccus kalidii]